MTGKARLIFDINAGHLHGTVGGGHISFLAASGGGGGAKGRLFYEDMGAVNNPFRTGQQKNERKGVRGGPIPAGEWIIDPPGHRQGLGDCARLTPKHVPTIGKRGGFYIHGRGKHGSDGCIVPMDPTNFRRLLDGLRADGGGTLIVNRIVDIPSHAMSAFA